VPVKIRDMRIGYARVSTEDQTIDLQKDALKRSRCREIYEEHATGKNTARPQLEACLKSLREGDTFVVGDWTGWAATWQTWSGLSLNWKRARSTSNP
jgi:hypothetical protein